MAVIIPAVLAYAQVITVGTAVMATLAYAYSSYQQRRARAKAKAAANAALQDRLTNIQTATAPRKLVLGRVRTGGAYLYIGSTGDSHETLYLVIELAAHPIDAVETVYFDGEALQLGAGGQVLNWRYALEDNVPKSQGARANGQQLVLPFDPAGVVRWVSGDEAVVCPVVSAPRTVQLPARGGVFGTVTYTARVVTPKAWVRWRLGSEAAPDAELAAAFSGTPHVYAGLACLIVRLEYDAALWQDPPTVTAVVRGLRARDPRTGVTGWTQNPAVLAHALLTHPLGPGLTDDDVDLAALAAAATACDTVTAYSLAGAVTQRPLYTAGYVHSVDRPPLEALEALVEAMAGRYGWEHGRLVLRAGVHSVAAGAIDETWLDGSGGLHIEPSQTLAEAYNVAQGTFADGARHYAVLDYPRVAAAPWIDADGGERPLDVDLEAVTHVGQAQHVADVLLNDARQALTVVLECKPMAQGVGLLTVQALTLPQLGWAGKLFIVLAKEWRAHGGVRLTLKETGAAIYTMALDFSSADPLPNTGFPSWTAMPTVPVQAVESGGALLTVRQDGSLLALVRVLWHPSSALGAKSVEAQWISAEHLAAGPVWSGALPAAAGAGLVDLPGLMEGKLYALRLRAVSDLGRRGPWSDLAWHTVQGKSAPPGNVGAITVSYEVGGVRFRWPEIADRDRADYALRLGAVWEGAAIVDDHCAANTYLYRVLEAGVHTLLVRARDTSGNLSPQATAAVFAIDAPGPVTAPRIEVSDNNVMLFWAPPTAGTLPVREYEVRRGDVLATASLVGSNSASTFAAAFEREGGIYTYWVAAIDTYGTVGAWVALRARVLAPAAIALDKRWPVGADGAHAAGVQSWDIDFGGLVPGNTITVSWSAAGGPPPACTLYHRATSGAAWSPAVPGTVLRETALRFMRVELAFSAPVTLSDVFAELEVAARSDGGTVQCLATDVPGTWVPFTREFLFADGPILQPQGATGVVAQVDYDGLPNPDGFWARLHNAANGARVSGPAAWTVRGVI